MTYARSEPTQDQTPQPDPLAKSRIAAGVFGIVLGGLGVHRFYLGYTAIGIAQIVVTLVTLGLGWIWESSRAS